jgi:hypothetical protein
VQVLGKEQGLHWLEQPPKDDKELQHSRIFHMSHDLGTVTIFRLLGLGLGFGLGKGLGLGL